MLTILLAVLSAVALPARGATIFVTTTDDKIGGGFGCSLKEAMYAARLHASYDGVHAIAINGYDPTTHFPNIAHTQCLVGDGVDDTIVLATNVLSSTIFSFGKVNEDDQNFIGPTATAMVTTKVTIEANGAILLHSFLADSEQFRLFAVGPGGRLTIRNAIIGGFRVHGGNGVCGGGGGMGAGGAIHVAGGTLFVENTTFVNNGAVGGNGSEGIAGGGGGMGGDGGCGFENIVGGDDGGGGGGARGNGARADFYNGGGGGGTVFSGNQRTGGYRCGADGGIHGDFEHNDGYDVASGCSGGGGGGGNAPEDPLPGTIYGGSGLYGGGGGGAADKGGRGGIGGGGGGGGNGGDGGFGAGGGGGHGIFIPGDSGHGGMFGSDGASDVDGSGGAGAGLGGAIFSYGGDVTIRNSTFNGNFVQRGDGISCLKPDGTSEYGCSPSSPASDAGGAVFAVNGFLKIYNSTIAGNHVSGTAAGAGGGVFFLQMQDVPQQFEPPTFVLDNNIIATNGTNECVMRVASSTLAGEFAGNLVQSNDSADPCPVEGIVKNGEDPLLGPLLMNGGFTNTMAITTGSPAYGTADPGTSLPADQRGQQRPSKDGHGYDIGAFEACDGGADALKCIIPKSADGTEPFRLRVLASPPDGGITEPIPNPSPFEPYLEPHGAVLFLNATPLSGGLYQAHYFVNWTGGVLDDPTRPSNAVLMDQDRTITANFQLHDFSMSVNPVTLTIPLGGSASSTVTSVGLGDFSDKINLSAGIAPAGVRASVSPNSTSAPYPASSSLSLTIGSSVTPQAYGQEVTGSSSGVSGDLSHRVVVPVTIVATSAAVVNMINQDQVLGCIDSSGVGQSLVAKINAYQSLASGGRMQGATNVLAAFQYEVQGQTGRHIATTCTDPVGGNQFNAGQTLIADAQSLQATSGTRLKPNPIVGSVVNSANVGLSGATVNLLNTRKSVVATTATDAVGFYYFADPSGLTAGTAYTVTVTLPKGYKSSSPGTQSFTWSNSPVLLPNFVLK
ncbi:MAG TPA: choice-of-anchor Q domain-containing protein [Vicinamibacterales bacterium]|nr:choice-of-anchor Q domain-containing protein [Vicinamibacterales bacterium]